MYAVYVPEIQKPGAGRQRRKDVQREKMSRYGRYGNEAGRKRDRPGTSIYIVIVQDDGYGGRGYEHERESESESECGEGFCEYCPFREAREVP